MKTLVLSLLTIALPSLSHAQTQPCLPIYVTNAGMVQALLKSDAYGAVNPAKDMRIEEPANSDLAGLSVKRTGTSASVRVIYRVGGHGLRDIQFAAFFKLKQTCDGKIAIERVYRSDEALEDIHMFSTSDGKIVDELFIPR